MARMSLGVMTPSVLLHEDLLGERHLVGLLLTRLAGHHNLAVTALHTSHGHLTVDFAHDSGVRRVACLEEFGDTWQTTGDVTTLSQGAWNLDERGTGINHGTIFHHHVTSHREVVCTHHVTVFVDDVASRHECPVFRLDDDFLGKSGGVVGLSLEGRAFYHVSESQLTLELRDDDGIERVPLGHDVAFLHHVAMLEV